MMCTRCIGTQNELQTKKRMEKGIREKYNMKQTESNLNKQ